MNIKDLIKQIPYAVQVIRRITTLVRSCSNKKMLKKLENTGYDQALEIREALMLLQQEPLQSDQGWKDKIEAERERLLRCNEPYHDGSVGDGGLYDHKGVSIKEACSSSIPLKKALLLFFLTRAIKPQNVIELGTNVGISSAYIGAALKVNDQNGKITTLDASPYRQRLAKELHRNLGIDNISYIEGLFSNTLSTTLANLCSIDFAFIDGYHQYQPTLDYFEEIMKYSTPHIVFIFDDIRWSDGMEKAWSRIQSDDRLGIAVDLYSVGICTRRHQKDGQRFVFDPIYIF